LYTLSFDFFFFIDPPTTHTYPLSLHDALPISPDRPALAGHPGGARRARAARRGRADRARLHRLGRRPLEDRRPHHRRAGRADLRSEEHTSELQSLAYLVCRLLLEKKKKTKNKQ